MLEAAAGQTQVSATQILCKRVEKGVELQATQQLHRLGELIYIFLTSSVSADFSNQAITCLQGKGDERLGGCRGTSWAACSEGCEPAAGQDSDAPALRGLHVGPALPESSGSHRELFPRSSSFHGCRRLQHTLLLQ